MTSLLQAITTKIPKHLKEGHHEEWMQFVHDFIPVLRQLSTLKSVHQYIKRKMKYRPEIITETEPFSNTSLYIFLLMNYLSSPDEFNNIEYVYILNDTYLKRFEKEFTLHLSGKGVTRITKI
jgi:hypothetical protein